MPRGIYVDLNYLTHTMTFMWHYHSYYKEQYYAGIGLGCEKVWGTWAPHGLSEWGISKSNWPFKPKEKLK